ncbi:MAG: GAF domain-containing protein, partial [Candidatus Hydrogenedentes bacterium]|nr:GAF domain-containing protein [Candidatus Hydrogenedentota bacterium]
MVFICDATGRLVQANAEFNRFFPEEDSPRRTRTLAECIPSEHDNRHITAALAQALAAQESVRLEVECLKGDGARAVLAIEFSPLPALDPDTPLIACVGYDVSESRKAQAALRYRLEFEKIITRISSEFINIAPNDVDSAISDALQGIVEFTDSRRGFVFLLDEGGQSVSNTHKWTRKGVDSNQQELQRLALHEFPWAVEKLVKSQESAIITDVVELPADAQGERRLLERLGVKSLVLAPMIFGGPTIGGVGLEGASKPREWTPDEIALLRFA